MYSSVGWKGGKRAAGLKYPAHNRSFDATARLVGDVGHRSTDGAGWPAPSTTITGELALLPPGNRPAKSPKRGRKYPCLRRPPTGNIRSNRLRHRARATKG